MNPNQSRKRKLTLGIFFSHPTQHQSVMFQSLSQREGLDVRIYYYDPGSIGKMYDPGYGTNTAWDVDLLAGTRSMVLPNWLHGRQISPFRQLNPAILKIMAQERFDAVFLSGYISLSNWLVLSMARRSAVHVLYFSDSNILDEQRKRQLWLKRVLRHTFLNQVDTFLTIGDKNRESYLRLGMDEQKMVWCPYPVDVRRFQNAGADPELKMKLDGLRRQYEIPLDAQVVALCAKLIPRKRPQDLIEALRCMNRQNVYGLLIGSGPLEDELKRSLSPDDRVRITGFVNQAMIPYHMLLADVGVVTSEWDPHPLVTTEFAACGLPVIVSHFCGVWGEHDILRPNENGLVYKCGDVGELASGITKILDEEVLRRQMSACSLELVRTQSAEYAADAISARLLAVFH